MLERIVVSIHGCATVLLRRILAVDALAAAINHAPNADGHACGKVLDVFTHRHNAPHDLMSGHHGKCRWAPFFIDLMYVRVADAGEQNFDGDVVGAGGAACDCVRHERAFAREGGVCFGFAHLITGLFAETGSGCALNPVCRGHRDGARLQHDSMQQQQFTHTHAHVPAQSRDTLLAAAMLHALLNLSRAPAHQPHVWGSFSFSSSFERGVSHHCPNV
jgi:hypothetical protein